MVRVRRHVFVPSGVKDWSGGTEQCGACPLPEGNDIHGVQLPSEEQMVAERRRIGERE